MYESILFDLTLDLHGGWENVTGHNAPLYPHEFDTDKTLNVVIGIFTNVYVLVV